MKKPCWKMLFPASVLQGVPNDGAEARRRAEERLQEVRRDLARTKAQTPYYAGLGRDLRTQRERNHIAERIRVSLREV